MDPNPLTLKEIDKLIAQVTRQGEFVTAGLLKTVRRQYRNDQDLVKLKTIPAKDLVKADTGNPVKYLASLKTSVNKNLEDLYQNESIPSLLKIDENNTFIRIKGKPNRKSKSRSGKSGPDQTGLRVSEITFNLPKEIHKEFKKNLEAIQKQKEALNKSMGALLKSENKLYQEKFELEAKRTALRIEGRKQMKNLRQGFDQERKLYQTENSRINKMVQMMQAENRNLLNRQIADAERRLKTNMEHQRALSKNDEKFKEQFHRLTESMISANESEKEFMAKLTQEMERLKTIADDQREAAEFQKNKQTSLDSRDRDLTFAKKSYRLQLEKEFREMEDELHLSFSRRSEYHRQRSNEEKSETSKLEEERAQLRDREIFITREIRDRAETKASKKLKEVNKLEKDLNVKRVSLENEELNFNREKSFFIENLPIGDEGQTTVTKKLEALLGEQEKVLRQKMDFFESLENDRERLTEKFERKSEELENERNEIIAILEREKSTYMENFNDLKDREKGLIERETDELKQVNDEYEILSHALEVERVEQNSDFDELREQIHNEQLKLRKQELKFYERAKKSTKEAAAREEESLKLLRETQGFKSGITKLQKEAEHFLSETRKLFEERLKDQNSEFNNFKNNINELESDAKALNQKNKIHEEQTLKESFAIQISLGKQLEENLSVLDNMENELLEKSLEYQKNLKEFEQINKERSSEKEKEEEPTLSHLTDYEDRLHRIGENFEKLSKSFHKEMKNQNITILPEDYSAPLEYDEDLAKIEWTLAVKRMLENSPPQEISPLEEFRSRLAEKWDEWISIPTGDFQMGEKFSREAAPYQNITIEKPFKIKKFLVTNIEFFEFINQTKYKTEAETGLTAIVYHPGNKLPGSSADPSARVYTCPTFAPEKNAYWLSPEGNPDSLNDKFSHPVTQITWNDAMAYCRWKSEATGKIIRLPSEVEWEYVASNLGKLASEDFHWQENEVTQFCNIEETGIFGTTAVDHFPAYELTAGAQDMFGNVHEWMMDSYNRPGRAEGGLHYKMARGGSFTNSLKEISQWRRFPFVPQYCSTFIGFRVVCEEE